MRAYRPYGVAAASKFVGRISQLDGDAVREIVQTWHEVMRASSDVWFAAEEAAGNAVRPAGLIAEQEVLLSHLSEAVLRGVWYRAAHGVTPDTLERRVGSTEASAQYVASVAALALLVADRLTADQFGLLYRPFARLVPIAELGPE